MGRAERLLGPAGPPTDGRRIGGPDDAYCHPKPGSWIKSF